MMQEFSYTLTIKKEYAIPILRKLISDDAIEVYSNKIPDWQKEETLRRIKEIDLDPSLLISSEDFWDSIDADDK